MGVKGDTVAGLAIDFTRSDSEWMRHALSLARRAEREGEVPVGSVIVRGNELVGEGWNRSIALNDPSAHAEIMALRDAGKRLKNYRLPSCVMYVTLEPCAMCVSASIHARIERLFYAASDPKTGALGGAYNLLTAHSHNHVPEARGGLLGDESSEQLRAFFRNKRLQRKG